MHDPLHVRKPDNGESERTLDMLDDLIGTIHRSRLSTFAARSRKHEKRMKRRAEQLSQATASRHRNVANLQFIDEQLADEEDERTLEEISSQFAVPAPMPVGPASNNSSKQALAAKAQLFKGSAQNFTSYDALQSDIKAVAIFDDFRQELEKFCATDPIRRNSKDGREEYADHLVEKYLAKKLDPLPTSKTVSGIRKALAEICEKLATADDCSADFASQFFGTEALDRNDELSKLLRDVQVGKDSMGRYKDSTNDWEGEVQKQELAKAKAKFKAAAEAPSENLTAAAALAKQHGNAAVGAKTVVFNSEGKPIETEAERQVREKARIKEQYEAYRRLDKANLAAVDKEKKKEHEALADDIRALISNVQNVGLKR